jgi:hypothetical protein
MKKKTTSLHLAKETLRQLAVREMHIAIGGGSLNCTNPTSGTGAQGCFAISIEGTGCP